MAMAQGPEHAAGDRCPLSESPAGDADGVEPRWSDAALRAAVEAARARAGFSHLNGDRAEAMASEAVRSRAESAGVPRIDETYVRRVGQKLGYGHPLSERTGSLRFTWTPEAEARLREVPEFCRELTRWRVEWTAHKRGLGPVITPEAMETKYAMWGEVSRRIEERDGTTLAWTQSAQDRLARVPDFVRGQVIEAVEGNAARLGRDTVDDDVLDETIDRWARTGDFHEGKFGFR
jgi:hypothetical protein